MIRVANIGLGRMGMLHLMSCLKIEGVKVVAAADSSKKALKKAERLGVEKTFTDYHDLFSHPSSFDVAIISLPNYLHFESTQLALETGADVFVEKPLANTIEQCKEIVQLVKKKNRNLMVGHVMRYISAVEIMKEDVDKGYIGNLEVMTIENVINGPFAHPRVPAPVSEWWFDPEKSGGGALLDIGYHTIDLFRYFGGESEVIFSTLDHKFNLPVEDGAIVILRSGNMAKGIVNVGWYEQTIFPKYDFRAIVHGNAGYINTDDLVPNLYTHAAKEGLKNFCRKLLGKKIRYLSYTYFYEAFFKEMSHFLQCVHKGESPPVTGEDGLRTIELVMQAYQRSENN